MHTKSTLSLNGWDAIMFVPKHFNLYQAKYHCNKIYADIRKHEPTEGLHWWTHVHSIEGLVRSPDELHSDNTKLMVLANSICGMGLAAVDALTNIMEEDDFVIIFNQDVDNVQYAAIAIDINSDPEQWYLNAVFTIVKL